MPTSKSVLILLASVAMLETKTIYVRKNINKNSGTDKKYMNKIQRKEREYLHSFKVTSVLWRIKSNKKDYI